MREFMRTLYFTSEFICIVILEKTQPQSSMVKSSVDPACTRQFSALFLDYLDQKPALSGFYNQFPTIGNFGKLIQERHFEKSQRDTLVHVLQAQYAGIDLGKIASQQILSLGDEKTFTVTTGHQLNLLTGPLYFIYKIVSTINLAKKLKEAYPSYHFVPVYWMATEDHDFEEINYFKLEGKKYQWKSDQKGPVGDFVWDACFREFLKEVSAFVPEFFLNAYQSSKTLSEAVRKYVHHLFREKGLLVVDGKDPELKKVLTPVMKADLLTNEPYRLATAQTQQLDDLGYKSQIYPREINLFYMGKGLRERIEKVGNIYKVLNTELQFTQEGMLEELESHPERFSPNVVLRPIYQELILPNLAYLGGPAEVAYWLQLKSMFDHFQVSFPAVMPRNFAVILDQRVDRKISQLGMGDADLFESVLDWKRKFVEQQASVDFQLENEKAQLSFLFQNKGNEAAALEKSLQNAFEAGKVRALKILEQLSDKIRKAEERRLEIQIKRRMDIQSFLYPGGSPQERTENMMRFFLDNPRLLEELLEFFDPFDFSYMILRCHAQQSAD